VSLQQKQKQPIAFCRRFLLLAPLLTASHIASASPSDYDEGDLFAEIPVVSSATRLEQNINDVPAAITILDKETIQASGITDVAQLFNLIPGFHSYHVFGNQFETARGIADDFPSDFEVLVDGRSVYEPINTAVEWASLGLSVQDIEYIEVVRGSNAPAYGSNASLGAINIITTSPVETTGSKITVTASDNDLDTRNLNIQHYFNVANANTVLRLNYRKNSGFPPSPNPQIPPEPKFDHNHDGGEILHLDLRSVFTPNVNNTIEFQVGIGDADIIEPDGGDTGDIRGFINREFKRSHQLIRWNHLFDTSDFQLTFYHNRLELNEDRRLGTLSEVLSRVNGAPVPPAAIQGIFGTPDEELNFATKDGLSERYDLELQFRTKINSNHRLVAGLGSRFERLRGQQILDHKDTTDGWRYRGFFNWEWTLSPSWLINAGMMGERSNETGPHFSPRLGINFNLTPNHTFRASATHSHRIPSLLEINEKSAVRFSNGVLIDTLQLTDKTIRETDIREIEIGYFANILSGKLQFDVRLFKTDVNGALSQRRSTIPTDPLPQVQSVLIADNGIDFNIDGAELQLKARPDEQTLLQLSYAHNRFTGTQTRRINPLKTRDLLHQLPETSVSFLVKRTLTAGLDLSLIWYHWSESTPLQGDFIDDRNRLDVRLAQSFQLGKTATTLELIVRNLNDEQQVDYDEDFPIERTVFARISFNIE